MLFIIHEVRIWAIDERRGKKGEEGEGAKSSMGTPDAQLGGSTRIAAQALILDRSHCALKRNSFM